MNTTKHETGAFVRIPLADGSFGYGRLLEAPDVAFYNYRTPQRNADLAIIDSHPVLFRAAVNTSGLKRWERLGVQKLAGEVAQPVVQFTQNILDFRKCVIFDSVGNERIATPEECVGLERAAVWEPHHIEQRLLDNFLGRPNDEEVRARVRLQ